MDIGAELSQARERRGWSLNEVAERTKISVLTLRAIERGAFQELPGGIFIRGYLRAYAREVGCDPEALVRRYLDTVEPPELPIDATALDTAALKPGQVHAADIDARERKRSWTTWISTAVVVIAGISFVHFLRSDTAQHAVAPAAVETAVVPHTARDGSTAVEAGTAGAAVDGAKPTDKPAAAPSTGLQLDIEPQGVCWVSALADDQQVVYRLMNPGEHARVEARDDVVLRVGDPATFRFTINGAAARQLGAAGEAVTAHITRQNYQTFLDR